MPSALTRLFSMLALGGAGLLVAVACFSERSETSAPDPDALCQLPIDAAGTTVIVIRGFAFAPAAVTVAPGTTVTWVNCEPAGTPSHTSTADADAWNSPLLAPGQTFAQTFDQAGSFGYHCEPHPSMVATITVE